MWLTAVRVQMARLCTAQSALSMHCPGPACKLWRTKPSPGSGAISPCSTFEASSPKGPTPNLSPGGPPSALFHHRGRDCDLHRAAAAELFVQLHTRRQRPPEHPLVLSFRQSAARNRSPGTCGQKQYKPCTTRGRRTCRAASGLAALVVLSLHLACVPAL